MEEQFPHTFALLSKIEEMTEELSKSIRKFDDDLNVTLNIDETTEIFECEKELDKALENGANEKTIAHLKSELIRLQEWSRVWNSLSNGVRCVLSDI